jgi:nicotinamide mononucleotide adenylyltransferase
MKYSLFIGRYSCLPPHGGHIKLIRTVLEEGKNACIAIRNTPISDTDPYTVEERKKAFAQIFAEEVEKGTVMIMEIPDIEDVCYGRKVGWGIREIKLEPEIEAISATEIRKKTKNKIS